MANDVINAVKRLQRAGSENSRATEKLHQAAKEVADLIEESVPVNAALPRGYRVIERGKPNRGYCKFLVWEGPKDEYGDGQVRYIDGAGTYLGGDFDLWVEGQTRDGSLKFAKDIADGLLDEIAAWLESRSVESEEAATVLASKG